MKEKNVTHICCLQIGDRFYCARDRKRKVWELTRRTFYFFNGDKKKAGMCKNDAGEERRIDGNTIIVFIRNSIQNAKLSKMVSRNDAGRLQYAGCSKGLLFPAERLQKKSFNSQRTKSGSTYSPLYQGRGNPPLGETKGYATRFI